MLEQIDLTKKRWGKKSTKKRWRSWKGPFPACRENAEIWGFGYDPFCKGSEQPEKECRSIN